MRPTVGATLWRVSRRPGLRVCLGHPTHLLGVWTPRGRHTPPLCAYPGGQAPGLEGRDQHGGRALALDHRHQRAGGHATREDPQVDLTWMLCRPCAFLLPEKFRDHCQLAPTDLQDWFQEQAAVPARVQYEHQNGGQTTSSGLGLSLDCFTSDQERHLAAHRMRNVATMMVLAEHSEIRTSKCAHMHAMLVVRCGGGPETARHLWECPVQSHEWRPARRRLHTWPSTCRAQGVPSAKPIVEFRDP